MGPLVNAVGMFWYLALFLPSSVCSLILPLGKDGRDREIGAAERRPHCARALTLLSGGPDFPQVGQVVRRPTLGGLINDYYREAA